MKIKLSGIIITVCLFLAACHSKPPYEQEKGIEANGPVTVLVNEYTKDSLQFSPIRATFMGIEGYNHKFTPIISDENQAKYLAFQKKYLEKARLINSETLQGQALLTYKVFLRDREMAIEGSTIPSHLIPINQMYGTHNFFAQLGSGKSAHPFKTEQDYRDFIKRSAGFAQWMDSAIEAMREGIQKNIVQPRPIVTKIIPQLKTHLVSNVEESLFYEPLKTLPNSIEASDKSLLISDYAANIRHVIIPAYQRMHDFLQNEYLPMARTTVGLSDLPGGKTWYQYLVKTHTTLSLTPDEIHAYGNQEVDRILSEMKKVKQTVEFNGSLGEFFEFLRTDDQFYYDKEQDLVDAYTGVKQKIDSRLPQLFDVFPKADYEVRPVPKYRAASAAGASYEGPAPDGSRPGIFYINTHNLRSQPKFLMETLSIHEAAPGHHFQIAIQQEVKDLPNYRKYGGYTVFAEGWALYAESLGKELGLFTDPYMWYGRLVDEQLRAMRLVVDTGLHWKGWSRERAIEYMLANSSMARSDVEAEVERYIVIPGQALAYKIGQRKIRELREYGEKTLGENFDIKKFHTQVLIDGSLPMPILEEKIKRWIAAQ